MTDIRGNGYVPDVYDSRDLNVDELGFGAAPPTDEINHSAFCPPVRDQLDTNSCVGQSVASAIFSTLRHREAFSPVFLESELTSVLFTYALARHQHQRPTVPLKDVGTYIRAAVKGLRRFGAPPEEAWPFEPHRLEWGMRDGERVRIERIQARPPLSAIRQGRSRKGPGGYYRVMGTSQRYLDQLDAALHAGLFPVLGLLITREFQLHQGETLDAMSGSPVGGHAFMLAGMRKQGGARYYLKWGSWGTGWGKDGATWIHEDLIAAGVDTWIIDP